VSGRQPVLIVIQGPEPGIVYNLPENRVTTVGRSVRNTVIVVNPSVSRYHCELSYVNGRWELHDLNSKRGTIVNGERVVGRRLLTPGDIIRLRSAVFRFDMIDESFDQGSALLAIKEAELDARLGRQARKAAWLDEVMAHNRMDSQDLQEDEGEGDGEAAYSLAASAVFVVAVAGLVVLGVLWALHLGRLREEAAPPRAVAARRAYAAAVSSLESGQAAEALRRLHKVEEDYPQTAEAQQAAHKRLEAQGMAIDQGLQRLNALEAAGDYAGALQAQAELQKLDVEPQAAQIVADQSEYVQRLARAAYRTMEKSAQERLGQGDRAGALELYRRMRDSVGIPELSAEAAAKVQELESTG
jgi:hypothetical protein